MVTYEIVIPKLTEQLKKLNAFDSIGDRHLTTAMQQSTLHILRPASENAPVYRGVMRASLGSEVRHAGPGSIIGRVGSSLKNEQYPATMEFGRKPGKMPPIEPLERWVHLKLGVPTDKARGVAFMVARSIARKGIKGRRFLHKAYEASKVAILQYFAAALERIAKDLAV